MKEAIDRLQKPQKLRSNQQFSLMRRPASSIQLQTTPTTLKIQIPKNQIEFQTEAIIGTMGYLLLLAFAVGIITSGLWKIILALALLIVLPLSVVGSIYLWLMGKLFPSSKLAQNQTALHYAQFELEDGAAFVSLMLDSSEKQFLISRQKLRSITVDSYRLPRYRLNVECEAENGRRCKLQIMGDRTEIQWLCDELIEWGGFQIEYREASGF